MQTRFYIGWIAIFAFFATLSANAQNVTNGDPIRYDLSIDQYEQSSRLLHLTIKPQITNPNIQLLQFVTLDEFSGFNSQVDVDTSLLEVVSIRTQEGNIKSLHIPAISENTLSVYEGKDIAFSVVAKLKKDIADLPVAIPLEWVSMSVEHQSIETYLVKGNILRKDIPVADAPEASATEYEKLSLWEVFWLAFVFGFLALLTPCIYAMMPLTVSFFIKKSTSRSQAIKNSSLYAISIIAIFSVLGLILTIVLGPTALNWIATNSIANLFFAVIFVAFALSFFGVFEMSLPAAWANNTSRFSSRTDMIGIFFMALTLVIVSFSCTGPIIGNLLVLASRGSWLAPFVGNLGFSISLAIPFFLLSIFPNQLNKLTKAGGWLNTIKVVLGFLELALALKFLSNADLTLGTRFLDREIFLSIWVVIFLMIGLYLLGFIHFKSDQPLQKNEYGASYISPIRLISTLISWAFVIYLIPGMWGAPLDAVSAFLPPMGTHSFRLNSPPPNFVPEQAENTERKYAKAMEHFEPDVIKQYGFVTYFDYQEALQEARKQHKPLMLDFTGVNCVNCRKMEAKVWSVPKVAELLKNKFVIASLYVDVQQIPLEESDITQSASGDVLTSVGDKYAHFQIEKFNANVQPYYFFLDENENKIVPDGYGYDGSADKFEAHLKKVLRIFKQRSEK